jgi:hypothetical protein
VTHTTKSLPTRLALAPFQKKRPHLQSSRPTSKYICPVSQNKTNFPLRNAHNLTPQRRYVQISDRDTEKLSSNKPSATKTFFSTFDRTIFSLLPLLHAVVYFLIIRSQWRRRMPPNGGLGNSPRECKLYLFYYYRRMPCRFYSMLTFYFPYSEPVPHGFVPFFSTTDGTRYDADKM